MSDALKPEGRSYDDFYRESSSRTSQLLRQEAHGTDIGQHSWITTEELEANISRLKLTGASRLLDLGCGPGGQLTFLLSPVGCHGSGMDLNAQAIAEGRARTASLRIGELVTFHETDLNASLSFASRTFDAVMRLDVILHLRDRLSVFREVARVLIPAGILFTDAGAITGSSFR